MPKNNKEQTKKIDEKELLKPHPEYNLIQMVKLIERGQNRIAHWQKKISEEQQHIEKMKAKIVEYYTNKEEK